MPGTQTSKPKCTNAQIFQRSNAQQMDRWMDGQWDTHKIFESMGGKMWESAVFVFVQRVVQQLIYNKASMSVSVGNI